MCEAAEIKIRIFIDVIFYASVLFHNSYAKLVGHSCLFSSFRPILYNCLCRSVKTQLLWFLLLTMAKEKFVFAQIFETDCSHNSLSILGSWYFQRTNANEEKFQVSYMILAVMNAIYAIAYIEAWKSQDFNNFITNISLYLWLLRSKTESWF